VNNQTPVYESLALLKIGKFESVKSNGSVEVLPIETARDLAKKISYLYNDKLLSEGKIRDLYPVKDADVNDYIEIVAHGSSPEMSSNTISNLVKYIQDQHIIVLNENRNLQKVLLDNLNSKLDIVVQTQRNLILKQESQKGDYEVLLNTIYLMSFIENEIGIDYLTRMLQQRESLEYLLAKEINNSELVGGIYTSPYPISPKRNLIIIFGFVFGVFISLFGVFLIESIKDNKAK